ncbi:hypothetical protein [Intestinibacter sp.]|uniref:hypothetical protein n=1 Tax=Intestinibacter sp. TaxID=1965304 RepID=UPI003F16B5FB
MIKTEFGIIENIEQDKDYSDYEPKKYNCIFIDDDLYIDDWWEKLTSMNTYFGNLNRPAYGLSRYGVTLIPPESLSTFQNIVVSDKRIYKDEHLVNLANKIQDAIDKQKYMIHFGI